jgi:hypothetical protein
MKFGASQRLPADDVRKERAMKQKVRRVLPVAFGLLAVLSLLRIDVIGYVTNGHNWGTNQVLYYVNPTNIYMSNAAAISAIQNGSYPWSSQTLANIQLVYGGTTSGSSLTLNNKNEVFFRNDSSSYIGETYWWYDGTGHLVDADMVLHENWQFYAGSGCTGSGVYVEDVAVHEFGHVLGLAHTGVAGATMYATMPSSCDLTQLTLESDDISGIESLYPPTSTSKNTAPTVSISSPGNGSSFANGVTISFAASASDSQDGNLTSSIAWTSSIDGAIGSGGSVSRTLSAGSHVITASVRDSGNLTGSTQITISVAAPVSLTASPDGTIVPTTATQIVDNNGALWTIGPSSAILRNGVSAAGGYGAKIQWQSSTIYVYGTDSNWWQWTGAGWTKGTPPTSGGTTGGTTTTTSSDGTTVPTTASQIVDNSGAIWTIGSSYAILRNGVSAGGGYGAKILWQSSSVYVYGTDSNWWQWTGSGWTKGTPPASGGTTGGGTTTSADGTMVPTTASQIVDNSGAIWTIGSSYAILRNGVSAGGGYGTKILWQSSTIYVYGTDSNWWQWTGLGWTKGTPTSGGTTGGTTTSADGTMVPTTATQIVDSTGAVWTIGASYAILRNGAPAGGGYGTKIYWKSATIYCYGTDSNWYRWTGSWVNIGPVQP